MEDIENVRTTLKDILELKGYKVIEAKNTSDGLKKLKANKQINLIVTDTSMPPGRNGYQFCNEIKNVQKLDLPVIIYTATYEIIDPMKAKDAGADDFIVKGTDPSEVIKAIKKYLK